MVAKHYFDLGGERPFAIISTRGFMGGLVETASVLQRGETVLVKPNMAWDRTPEQGANTHPEVVAEVVRECRAAGARRVIVAENPVHDAGRGAERSGIAAAVRVAGGTLVLPDASGFTGTALGGSVLASWDVLSVLLAAKAISPEHVERVRRAQKMNGLTAEQNLLQLGVVSEVQLAQALAAQAGLPYVKINPLDLDLDVVTNARWGGAFRRFSLLFRSRS